MRGFLLSRVCKKRDPVRTRIARTTESASHLLEEEEHQEEGKEAQASGSDAGWRVRESLEELDAGEERVGVLRNRVAEKAAHDLRKKQRDRIQ